MAGLTLDWFQLGAVVGALHGVLLTGVLLAQRNNRTANRILAALMAAFALYLASSVYYSTPLFRAFPYFFGVSYPMPWIFGPLVYLYARAASDRAWRFTPKALVHFVPAVVSIVVGFQFYMMGPAEKIAAYDRWTRGGMPPQIALIDPLKYVSGIAYSAATVLYLRRHRRHIQDNYSNTARVNLVWLGWLAGSAMAIWAFATTLRLTGANAPVRDEQLSLAIALLIYAIGYLGLRQPEVFRYVTTEFPVVHASPAPPAPEAGASEEVPSRYERSGLGDDEAMRLKSRLLELMDKQQPWKDSELTLADLAARLDSTPHKLSEVLNVQVGSTFYDFVNAYRVREVQRRIAEGDAARLKMLALALDAGFSSKSTFNHVFKKHTSQTPSDFRQAIGV